MGTQLVEYISGASFGGRLEARPWLGRASHGPASSRGGPWRSACSGGGRRGHGTLAAGGAATEAEELGPIKTEITN